MVYATDKWDHPGLFPMFCLEPLAKLSEMAMERERERERDREREREREGTRRVKQDIYQDMCNHAHIY